MSDGVRVLAADVAVVGAGPAGLAAACRAAEAGRRVVVLDEAPHLGGQIWRHRDRALLPAAARKWLERFDRSGALALPGTSVVDVTDRWVSGIRRHEMVRVEAPRLVIATGARELFLPFPGWTLPNVAGVGGLQALLKSGVSFAGKRVALAGAGPLLLPVAASLARAGARLVVVADRTAPAKFRGLAAGLLSRPGDLWQGLRYRAAFAGVPYRWGTRVVKATGEGRVTEVTLSSRGRTWTASVDVLGTAAGLVPNSELARLGGCDVRDGTVVVDDTQRTTRDHIWCAGEPTGVGGVDLAQVEGEIAGLDASGRPVPPSLGAARDRHRAWARRLDEAFRVVDPDPPPPDTLVCRCEDVPLGALRRDWSFRQAKLYTRVGMGSCQGRVCGAALRAWYGWNPDSARTPLVPATVASLVSTLETPDATA